MESYPYSVKEGQQYIHLNPGRLFVQQPPRKKERDREAHLNYYASAYNRGSGRQLSHRKTKLNQIQQNTRMNLDSTKLTKQNKPRFDRLLRPPPWKRSSDYSRRNGRDGQKTKIGKANEKKKRGKVKSVKDEKVNGREEKSRKGGTSTQSKWPTG